MELYSIDPGVSFASFLSATYITAGLWLVITAGFGAFVELVMEFTTRVHMPLFSYSTDCVFDRTRFDDGALYRKRSDEALSCEKKQV